MNISRILNPPKSLFSLVCFKCKCISHCRILCTRCNSSICRDCLDDIYSNPKICLNCHTNKTEDFKEEQLKSTFWKDFRYKCKNSEFGCNQNLWYTEIFEHEKKCDSMINKKTKDLGQKTLTEQTQNEEALEKDNTNTSDTENPKGIMCKTTSSESVSKFPISSYKNTHYLFYIETHKDNHEIMHIKNLLTNEKYMEVIPGPGSYNHQVEFYKNSIFCCGGVLLLWSSLWRPIDKCWVFDLLTEKTNTSLVLKKARFGVSLVSTPNALFCIGGKGQSFGEQNESFERTCEYLTDVNKGWQQTCDLESSIWPIHSIFMWPRTIYIIGTSGSSEYFGSFDCEAMNGWKNLQIRRRILYGFHEIKLNSREFLLFGDQFGGCNYEIINSSSFSIKELENHPFPHLGYGDYKPIIFEKNILFISYTEKKIYKMDQISLKFETSDLDF